jgi:hypothetical protein
MPRQPLSASPRSPRRVKEKVNRALDVMERFLRRFMDIVREGKTEKT